MKVMFVPPENESNRYVSSLTEELERDSVEVVDYSWNALLPVLGAASSERPDVVHIHWLHLLTIGPTWIRTLLKGIRTPVELLLVRLLGINVVWTVHNLTAHQQTYPRWEFFWRIIVARWCCNHLIVHCEAAKISVRERYRLGTSIPITVIPHGHYIDQYPERWSEREARDHFGFDRQEVVFAYFGQIRPYKQVPHLINVFDNLDRENSRLLIAGNPRTESLRQRVLDSSKGRDDVLTRLKFIPDEEVARYFEAADVVVLPYRDILTSGTAILALSFARPVIVPRIGCLPELVTEGDTGFLYDPADSRGLERAMERALVADLDEMGENGYEAIADLDWNRIAKRTRQIYEA